MKNTDRCKTCKHCFHLIDSQVVCVAVDIDADIADDAEQCQSYEFDEKEITET